MFRGGQRGVSRPSAKSHRRRQKEVLHGLRELSQDLARNVCNIADEGVKRGY